LEVHTDESWIGYRLTAILFRDGERENACELPLDLEHICILPPALLAEPCTLQIGLRGLIDDPDTDADAACRTTSLVRLRVAEGTPAEAGETLVNPTDATADENAVLAGETFYAGGGKAARTGNIPTYEEGTPTILTPYTETDPTVPDWAKQPAKPTYTAAEIGAAPAGFGLGSSAVVPPNNSLNEVKVNGWYYASPSYEGAPTGYTGIGYGVVHTICRTTDCVVQEFYNASDQNIILGTPLKLIRIFNGNCSNRK
jgi:hypothetical protein